VSEHLVDSTAFKAAETGDPRLAGSIPVHLRHVTCGFLAQEAVLVTEWSREPELISNGSHCLGCYPAI